MAAEITCEQVAIDLSAYIDNELSDGKKRLFAGHIQNCISCRQKYSKWLKNDQDISQLKSVGAPPDSWSRIKNSIADQERVRSVRTRKTLVRILASSVAVFIICIGLYLLFGNGGTVYELPNDGGIVRSSGESDLSKVNGNKFKFTKGELFVKLNLKNLPKGKRPVFHADHSTIDVLLPDVDGIVEFKVKLSKGKAHVNVSKGQVRVASKSGNVELKAGESFNAYGVLISDLHGDTNGWYGQTRNQRAVIQNHSASHVSDLFLNVYLSTDDTLDKSDALGATEPVSIDPLKTIVVNYRVSIPSDWKHKKIYAIAVVESNGLQSSNQKWRGIGMTKFPYDINGDEWVNLLDIVELYSVIGTSSKDVRWNSSADSNNDGVVDLPNDAFELGFHIWDRGNSVETHLFASHKSGESPLNVKFSYNSHYYYGAVTKVEIDYGDGMGWNVIWTGNQQEIRGVADKTYKSKKAYTTKIRATDNNAKSSITSGPTITVR